MENVTVQESTKAEAKVMRKKDGGFISKGCEKDLLFAVGCIEKRSG